MRKLSVVSMGLTILLASGLWADEGRIPIFRSTVITQPGHYVVTRDIVEFGLDAIIIQANNVTVDLNGKNLIQAGICTSLVHIDEPYTEVTIRGGRLLGGGILIGGSLETRRIRIEEVEIVQSCHDGILARSRGLIEVINCRIIEPAFGGIQVTPLDSGTFSGRFTGNTIVNPGGSAIGVSGLINGMIRDNAITHDGAPSSHGIVLGGTTCGGNVIEGNIVTAVLALPPTSGILSNCSHTALLGNVVRGWGGAGIDSVGSGNTVAGNIVGGNGQSGVRVGGSRCLVQGNQFEGNGRYGIEFSDGNGHAYKENMSRGNALGAVGGSANTDAGGNIL